MTTTPEDRERARCSAEVIVRLQPVYDPRDVNLARCYLDLHAQLAESERARGVLEGRVDLLRGSINGALNNLGDHGQAHVRDARSILERALVIDRRSARYDALAADRQETKVEPSDQADRMLRIDGPEPAPFGNQRRQFEPLPPTAETKPREPGCKCHLEEGDSPCPVHGEDEAEPTAERPPEAAEPSDEALLKVGVEARRAVSALMGTRALDNAERRALYNAGRASEAAAHAETRQELVELRVLYNAKALKRENDRLLAELERVRGELEHEYGAHANTTTERDRLRAELSALREGGEEPTARELGQKLQAAAAEFHGRSAVVGDRARAYWDELGGCAKRELLGVRPRVPTREELARLIRSKIAAYHSRVNEHWVVTFDALHEAADAVIALFATPAADRKDSGASDAAVRDAATSHSPGSSPAEAAALLVSSSETEEPSPLPEVLPAKTRWWTETLEAGTYDPGYRRYRFSDGCTLDPKFIDWAYYRAQQQPAATPGPTLESLDARLREVETQVRVTRRLAQLPYGDPAHEHFTNAAERIEREERETAK